MSETEKSAKRAWYDFLQNVQPEHMTFEEQQAVNRITRMVWRWEAEADE